MPSDFNGDGRDDILWRNPNGGFSNWLATSTGAFTVNDANAYNIVPTSWMVGGTGDFNGDGLDDIVWTNFSASLMSTWLATPAGGYVVNDAAALQSIEGDTFVLGVGDFNHDGRDDVLMGDGTLGIKRVYLGDPDGGLTLSDTNYPVIAGFYVFMDSVADFDGDGWADVLTYEPIGGNVSMYHNVAGLLVPIDTITPNAGHGWWIAGTGDFNGDGRDDILWRNSNGAVSNWLSNGLGNFVVNDGNALTMVGTNWSIVGIGDYNGDGRDDVLWRNEVDGTLSNWLATANGGFVNNDAAASVRVALDWFVHPSITGAGYWDY